MPPKPFICRRASTMVGMGFQTGVMHPSDLGMALQKSSHRHGRLALSLDADLQRLQTRESSRNAASGSIEPPR